MGDQMKSAKWLFIFTCAVAMTHLAQAAYYDYNPDANPPAGACDPHSSEQLGNDPLTESLGEYLQPDSNARADAAYILDESVVNMSLNGGLSSQHGNLETFSVVPEPGTST
ncbi:MAG: hypothetical protein KJN98_03255, partial [Pontiella sp.]|nr:hypothetical protein [Pontiella sp.]